MKELDCTKSLEVYYECRRIQNDVVYDRVKKIENYRSLLYTD